MMGTVHTRVVPPRSGTSAMTMDPLRSSARWTMLSRPLRRVPSPTPVPSSLIVTVSRLVVANTLELDDGRGRVSRDVGQALPDHRGHVAHEVGGGDGVERTVQLDAGTHRERGLYVGDHVHHRGSQATRQRRLELEDRNPDLLDGVVEVVDGLLERRHGRGVVDAGNGRLDDEPGGEDLLDDVVMEVAGDARAVLQEQHPLLVAACLRQLQRHGGLVGERRRQLGVDVGERRSAPSTHHDQRASHLLPTEQRQDHHRSDAHLAGEVDRATVDARGVLRVGQADRLAGLQHVLAERAGGGVPRVLDAGGILALGHGHAQLAVDRHHDCGEVGSGETVHPPSDQP